MATVAPRFAAPWRVALFLLAVGSLPALWYLAGGGVGVTADRAELDRARKAMTDGRYTEARVRAEGVISRRPAGPDSPAELKALAGDASLLSAEARFNEASLERDPASSELLFVAWRASQAATLGADAAEARRLRLAAARRLLALGRGQEAIAELEKLETERELGGDGRRDLALALANGNEKDQAKALGLADRLTAEAQDARDRARARLTRGRVLAAVGNPAAAEADLAAAALELDAEKLPLEAAEARLHCGEAVLAQGRAAEAAPLLRAVMMEPALPDVRQRAGISLLEADAVAGDPAFTADFNDLRDLPSPPEVLFSARARVARRRLDAGRRADAAAGYAAAFELLGMKPFPAALVSADDVLRDLQNLFQYGPDPNDLPALGRATEGLAVSLGDSEEALELAAEISTRRAELADERARAAEQSGSPAVDVELEARALHGRAAELRLEASDGQNVVKSRSASNRFLGARELFRGGFHEAAVPVLRRLAHEFDASDEREAESRWMAARSLQELGRHTEAEEVLVVFLKDPTKPESEGGDARGHRNAPRWAHDAFVALAGSQEKLGKLDDAERTLSDFLFHYDNVTPDAPRWRDALYALGEAQARIASALRAAGKDSEAAEKSARAERNLADATRRFPAAWAQRFSAEATLGRLAMARRDWDAGAKRLKSALSLPRRDANGETEAAARRASLLLGECLLQLGETSQALEAFGQAWATDGGAETAVALARMADCHERLGDPKQAARFRDRSKAAFDRWRKAGGDGRSDVAAERLVERLVAGR